MTTELAGLTTDQPSGYEMLQSPGIQNLLGEIRALHPGLERLLEAFGELHELLDEGFSLRFEHAT